MTTSCSSLHLGAPSSNIVDHVEMPVDLLPPNESTNVQARVKIIPTATPYEQLPLRVALHFTPPEKNELVPIQHYDLQIQVSEIFHHDPESKVLLITNSETSAEVVALWKSLVCERLNMKMDICNVSLEGHFDVMTGSKDMLGQNLFKFYKAKTIIMLGNTFPYFERDQRRAIDLVDEEDLEPAMTNEASLFISTVESLEQNTVHVPRLLRPSSIVVSREFKTIKKLVSGIVDSRKSKDFFKTRFICQPKGKVGNQSQRCLQKATRAGAELLKRVPDLRFVISWIPASALNGSPKGKAGKVEVLPCRPYGNSKVFFTNPTADHRFTDVNTFCILLSLQLPTRLGMLWDELENSTFSKILFDVIEYDLVIEMKRFSNPQAPWPDSLQSGSMHSYLKRLDAFLTYDPNRQFSQASVDRITLLLGNLRLLADCCVGTWPRALTFATRRKALCSALTNRFDTFLNSHYVHLRDKTVNRKYSKYLADQSKNLKSIPLPNRKIALIRQIVNNMGLGVGFISQTTDIYDVEMMGNVVVGVKWEQFHVSHKARLKQDLAHAKDEVFRMMSG